MNVDIDEFDCEELRNNFAALKTDYQKHYGHHMDDYSIGIGKGIKTKPKSGFKYFDFKQNTRWVPICFKF
jgi:hypothetical protein